MADNVMFNVRPSFDLFRFAEELANQYRAKGYLVNVANLNGTAVIRFEKGTGGINSVVGLAEGIRATCLLMGNALTITFSDAEWTSKIIGFVIGWILCFIPIITAAIGTVRQLELPKSIAGDAMLIASGM